jgi:preprotein translocase subunit SecG
VQVPVAAKAPCRYHPPTMVATILGVVQVFLCLVLIFLVLMHSGKDAGLSGAFGVGTGAGPFGGGSLVERNLNRWTIGFAIAFAINTIILIKVG